MAQLMEVIERTGTGFTIYYYPAGKALDAVKDAPATTIEQTLIKLGDEFINGGIPR